MMLIYLLIIYIKQAPARQPNENEGEADFCGQKALLSCTAGRVSGDETPDFSRWGELSGTVQRP